MVETAVDLFVEVISSALPFTIAFWIGDFIVVTFLRAAFGGKLTFRGS